MHGKVLLSTAYMPPLEYFSLIKLAGDVLIESHENYIKQTYRNRCYILSHGGPLMLNVPVLEGSRRKVQICEVKIDYSKRWQQVHLRALRAAYSNSPFYDFYFEEFEDIIQTCHKYLFELNCSLLNTILRIIKLKKDIRFTSSFEPVDGLPYDYRYSILPDSSEVVHGKKYLQVFGDGIFTPNLSIVDLVFNQGPQAVDYL